MARFKSFSGPSTSEGRDGRSQSRRRDPKETRRRPLLDLHRLTEFKYDLDQLLSRSAMDETKVPALKATVIAKGSRISIPDAKSYIKEVEERDKLEKKLVEELFRLLDRYTRYR